MSASSKKRALRSLKALTGVRRHEEKKALRRLSRARLQSEEKRQRLEELRNKRRSSIAALRTSGVEGAGGGGLVRQRLLVDLLRGCEKQLSDDLARTRQEGAAEQLHYQEARSRRKLVEILHDRRESELSEILASEAEKLDASRVVPKEATGICRP